MHITFHATFTNSMMVHLNILHFRGLVSDCVLVYTAEVQHLTRCVCIHNTHVMSLYTTCTILQYVQCC